MPNTSPRGRIANDDPPCFVDALGVDSAGRAQVFFIGLGLFAGSENLVLHTTFGWILHLAPLLVLIAAALAGAGRTRILQAVALVVVVWIVPILAAVRANLPCSPHSIPLAR